MRVLKGNIVLFTHSLCSLAIVFILLSSLLVVTKILPSNKVQNFFFPCLYISVSALMDSV